MQMQRCRSRSRGAGADVQRCRGADMMEVLTRCWKRAEVDQIWCRCADVQGAGTELVMGCRYWCRCR